ncbi:MAG: DUF268 domain-containing protein [Humidesulfovibrio sp.]|nr:DUF268 domain-containing protein [Humidesulfovibrio sp.]
MNVKAALLEELPSNSRFLLYGACEFARFVLERLAQRQGAGIQIVGFIDGNKTGIYCGLPIVSPTDLSASLLRDTQVILTLGSYRQAFRSLEQVGVTDCYLLYVERELFRVEENRLNPGLRENMKCRHDRLEWMVAQCSYQLDAALELLYGPPVNPPQPPSEIPADLLDDFSMQGRASITKEYCNHRRPTNHPYIYTDREIDAYIKLVMECDCAYYGITNTWLYQALETYSLSGKKILIIGSNCPWYEALCLAHSATPYVVEYGNIISTSDRIHIVSSQYVWSQADTYDACFSISSLEHDGLGAYGDPVDPNSDLETMKRTLHVLKPGGLLFLSMPVGVDSVRFNASRVYGPVRLARVMEGWNRKDSYGYSEDLLETRGETQPLFVLEKPLASQVAPCEAARHEPNAR